MAENLPRMQKVPGSDSPELPSKKKKEAQGKTFYIAFSLHK